MFNDRTTPLSLLATRRSGKPRDLVAPGPDAGELRQMLAVAARTPDHGKLAPWRFVIVRDDQRDAFAALLADAYRAERPDAPAADLAGVDQFARQAPALVVVVSSPVHDHKVPVWEQELSAGAAAMNLLHAAHALGYGGKWITGPNAYDPAVASALGLPPPHRLAGFLYLGTPETDLPPVKRPEPAEHLANWTG